jgi:hypothetical protein
MNRHSSSQMGSMSQSINIPYNNNSNTNISTSTSSTNVNNRRFRKKCQINPKPNNMDTYYESKQQQNYYNYNTNRNYYQKMSQEEDLIDSVDNETLNVWSSFLYLPCLYPGLFKISPITTANTPQSVSLNEIESTSTASSSSIDSQSSSLTSVYSMNNEFYPSNLSDDYSHQYHYYDPNYQNNQYDHFYYENPALDNCSSNINNSNYFYDIYGNQLYSYNQYDYYQMSNNEFNEEIEGKFIFFYFKMAKKNEIFYFNDNFDF